ncbi:DUF4340 domain-containing protein [Leptospira adleri]|uniref:DUF4340 domain-containing protein n=1 Tax=Leptospira adleri TaxID=2023186 RepID=A0A2M9YM08_9LEPT|nr:DUF4340 domain-containing protein [Leptospira adleri]PJZ52575.1 hypothetical protein CH380_14030 [Leptospira adleri]PJZ60970.1 hypothetical protein CH376_15785 [Leptospira adleri]
MNFDSFPATFVFGFFKKEKALFLFLTNVVLGTVFFLTSDPFSIFQRTYQNSEPFFPYKSSEVETIRIGRKGHEILLERKNGSWIVQDGTARPDIQKIESLLSTLLKLRKFSKIASRSKNQNFGLNGDELKLEIRTESVDTGKLEIGVSGKQEKGTFVRDPENEEIWFVEENLNSVVGRGNENFFFSDFLFPQETDISVIHTILIDFSVKKVSQTRIKQTSPDRWVIPNSDQSHCWGENCRDWVEKLLKTKAERILKKPFRETIQSLSSSEKLKIQFLNEKKTEPIYEIEWIGKTSQKEPIFRSGKDSVLYVLDAEFLDRFQERFDWMNSSPDSF